MPPRKQADETIEFTDDEIDHEQWGVSVPMTGAVRPRGDVADDDTGDTPVDRLARMLGAVADDERATVRVYRVIDGNSHKLDWCANYSVQAFEQGGDLALIRREWGPGQYQIRLYAMRTPEKGGGYGVVAKQDVGIAVDPNALAAPAAQARSEVADVMRAMVENQQRFQESVMQALAQRPDPMQNLSQTFALAAQMREAFGVNAAANASPRSQLSEIVSAIKELREASAEINPPPAPVDDSGGLLPLAGQIMEMVRAQQQASQAAQQHIVPLPDVQLPAVIEAAPRRMRAQRPDDQYQTASVATTQSSPQPQPQPQPEQQSPEMIAKILELRRELGKLIALAASGKSADDCADDVYEQLPDEVFELIALPQWFDLLCQFEPACKPHETWFRAVVAICREYAAEDAAAADEIARPAPESQQDASAR